MSLPPKQITLPPLSPEPTTHGDEQTFADCTHQAAGLDLNSVLLRGQDQAVGRPACAGEDGGWPVLQNVVLGNLGARRKIERDIAHINTGHSDPTMISVDIREINQEMGALALKTQVVMKVEQSGIGAVKQLLSSQ